MSNNLKKLLAAIFALLIACPSAFAVPETNNADPGKCQQRLTLVSGQAVADSASSNTIYGDNYGGSRVSIFDTTHQIWVERTQPSEIGLLLSGLTAGNMYSVYEYWNGTSLAFDPPVSWTNATTPDVQAYQDGVLVKSADHSRRYVGCFCALTSSTTEDDKTQRLLCNAQNCVRRPMLANVPTSTWSVTYTAPYPIDYNSTNGQGRSTFVCATPSTVECSAYCYYVTNPTVGYYHGISLDSTSAFAFNGAGQHSGTSDGLSIGTTNTVSGAWDNVIGLHFVQQLEMNTSGGATTITGTSTNGMTTYVSN